MKAPAYTDLSPDDYAFFCECCDLHIALFKLNISLMESLLELTPHLDFVDFLLLDDDHELTLETAHVLCDIYLQPLKFFNL